MWTVVGTIAVVLATVIGGLYADRRWGILPRKERLAPAARPALPGHAAGEAPATALRVADTQVAELRTQRCCREAMEALADDQVRYGGHELTILRFRCGRCEQTRSLYVQRLVP